MHEPSRPSDRLLVALFLGAVSATLVSWAVRGVPEVRALPEERMSVVFPAWPEDLATFEAYPARFQSWFEDACAGREALLSARSRVLVRGFGVSPTPTVFLGRDDWIFLSEARQWEIARGLAPFGAHELDAWAGAIRARERWCAARGITYVFALVPDKTDVYPERHEHPVEALGPTRFDQLAERLRDEPSFLDLRPAVRAAKDADRDHDHAYFPFGSHWTDRGATAGTNAILARVASRSRFSSLAPYVEDDFVHEPQGIEGDSWAARLYLRGVWVQAERAIGAIRGREPVVVEGRGDESARNVSTLDDATLPRIVALHDSFGIPLYKFFSRRASRCVFLRGDAFRPEVVESETPDVVLEIWCERVLAFPPVENLPEQSALTEARFEASTRVLYRLDAARDRDAFAQRGGVEATADPDGAGLRVHWVRERALARFPAAFLPVGEHVLVRLDVEVERAGELQLFYLTPEQRDYTRNCMITRSLAPGTNRITLDLDVPGLRGPILFRATSSVGAFTLRGVETRRAP